MLQGDVKNLPLPALLQGLVSNHNSGILTLESEQRIRRIGVSGGGIEILHDSDGNSEVLESIVTALDILQPGEISNILSNLGSAALGDAPLALASGITPENANLYAPLVDIFLVATGINFDGDFHNIDPARLNALLEVTRNARKGAHP